MPKLLIASPNNNSFSETFIRNQTKGLKPDFLISGGWYPYKIGNDTIFEDFLKFEIIRGFTKKFFFSFYKRKYDIYLSKFLTENQITHVLIHYGNTAVHMKEALQMSNCNFTVHFHGFDAFYHQILKDYKPRYSDLFNKAHKIVAVSKDMYDQLALLGAPKVKLFLQPYGADLTLFQPINKNINKVLNLLFVGRLTAKKSPILLLEAFKIVNSVFPNVTLSIVGDGELKNQVTDFIKVNNLTNKVRLLGVLNPKDVRNQLQQCDLFVQHSVHADNGDSEGTPNTIIEAAACGKAIVSTFHAGIKEAVINKITGLLVNEGDYEAMAEKIIFFIKNPKICQEMGQAGRKHIENNYDLRNTIPNLQKIVYS